MRRLEEKYNLKTKEMEGRIKAMCNLSDAVEERGEKRLNELNRWLFKNGRASDVEKATEDPAYQKELFKEMAASLQ